MPYEMIEGWGLTHDDNYLYSSDGTDLIYVIEPSTFKIVSSIQVYDEYPDKSVEFINELEHVNGFIYANVLPHSIIIKIDKNTGKIVQKYDLNILKNI